MKGRAAHFSSQSVDWPTPKALFDKLNREFHFDFDPCPYGGGYGGWNEASLMFMVWPPCILQPTLWPSTNSIFEARARTANCRLPDPSQNRYALVSRFSFALRGRNSVHPRPNQIWRLEKCSAISFDVGGISQ